MPSIVPTRRLACTRRWASDLPPISVSRSATRRCRSTAATAISGTTAWKSWCAICACIRSWKAPTRSCAWSSHARSWAATAGEARALGKQSEVGLSASPPAPSSFAWRLGVVIFGLTLPATRLAVADFDPLFVTLGRSLLAAAFAGLTLLWARPPLPLRRDWPRLAAFAVVSIIGFPLLMAVALQDAPASHGAVVLAVLPLLTAMSGALVAGERPSLGFWACAVAGTGSALVYSHFSGSGSGALQWADLLLAASAVSAAMAYALGGEMARRIGGCEVICWALVFSAPTILPPLLL